MSATDSLLFSALPAAPDFSIEKRLLGQGRQAISGVDEAGRGPLAGPVVAAAVVLDTGNIPDGLNDSKKLTHKHRVSLFQTILETSHVAWSAIPPSVIDQINIRAATLQAMTVAVQRLPILPDASLIDGRDVPDGLITNGQALVKGDARSVSIAAASIVAKVIRDHMMIEADKHYPAYGFAGHKGYGAASHLKAIAENGPCPLHRRSFSPIKNMS